MSIAPACTNTLRLAYRISLHRAVPTLRTAVPRFVGASTCRTFSTQPHLQRRLCHRDTPSSAPFNHPSSDLSPLPRPAINLARERYDKAEWALRDELTKHMGWYATSTILNLLRPTRIFSRDAVEIDEEATKLEEAATEVNKGVKQIAEERARSMSLRSLWRGKTDVECRQEKENEKQNEEQSKDDNKQENKNNTEKDRSGLLARFKRKLSCLFGPLRTIFSSWKMAFFYLFLVLPAWQIFSAIVYARITEYVFDDLKINARVNWVPDPQGPQARKCDERTKANDQTPGEPSKRAGAQEMPKRSAGPTFFGGLWVMLCITASFSLSVITLLLR